MEVRVLKVDAVGVEAWGQRSSDGVDCFHLELGDIQEQVQAAQVDDRPEAASLLWHKEEAAVEARSGGIQNGFHSLFGQELVQKVEDDPVPSWTSGRRLNGRTSG